MIERPGKPPCAFQPVAVGSPVCRFCGNHRGEHLPPDLLDLERKRKRCYCGSGLANGLCVTCWPQ